MNCRQVLKILLVTLTSLNYSITIKNLTTKNIAILHGGFYFEVEPLGELALIPKNNRNFWAINHYIKRRGGIALLTDDANNIETIFYHPNLTEAAIFIGLRNEITAARSYS